jgi:hypothetical protein
MKMKANQMTTLSGFVLCSVVSRPAHYESVENGHFI